MGTLLPMKGWRTYAHFREELRQEVNQWIRSSNEFEGVLDFDEVVRDKEDPAKLSQECDSGDHLHPSEIGYEKMAGLVMRWLKQ